MRYALTYGGIAGLIVIVTIMAGLTFAERDGFFTSEYLGYLVMLVALSLIFVGVKRYRDVEAGGVIRFLPALKLGLGIAAVAALVYVLVWELHEALTGYRFMDQYLAGIARRLAAEGRSAAEIAREMAGYEWMRANYPNPLVRIPMVFLEIFPVGLVVALISAGLLRNPRLLPARTRK